MPADTASIRTTSPFWRRVPALTIAVLAPLVVALVLSRYEVGREARGDAELAATFVLDQTDTIFEEARNAALGLVPLTAQTCEQLMPELVLRAALVPYLRSLSVIDGERIYCSSLPGQQHIALGEFGGMPAHSPAGEWLALASSTPIVPHRPAFLLGEPGQQGRIALAIVDDRYLRDLLRAAVPLDIFGAVELRTADGHTLREVPAGDDGAGPLLVERHARAPGAAGAVELRIYGSPARMRAVWYDALARYLPIAACVSIALVLLVHRFQESRASLREQILRAIRADEFHVEYQPVIDVGSGRCHGAEALLRWNLPDGTTVSPDTFISAAEEGRVIVPLTQHLLRLVARDFIAWSTRPGFHLGVNFSPEHLESDALLADVRTFASAVAVQQPQIVVEVTERSLLRNTGQARSNLEALRRDGMQVAIDDFGTGYCSLSYLEQFPFDVLKIDRGFVLTIDSHREAAILDTIIELAHRLGTEVIAEGVDSREQLDYLRARGVTLIQGWLFGMPMHADAFGAWYRDVGSRPGMVLEVAAQAGDA